MKEMHSFLIPDYFTCFSCKMGECRSACCIGWPISISMQNYFHLLGIDCPKPLREQIDCSLHVYDYPTKDRYACFEPRFDGDCPLRMCDGRCSLHTQMGEEVLPDICRLYPRGVRIEDGLYECSCANSCEAVLEILWSKQEPIHFLQKSLTIQLPPIAERKTIFETLGLQQEIRLYFISIIQDRRMLLCQRILCLGSALDRMDNILKNKNKQDLDQLLQEKPHMDTNLKEVDSTYLEFALHIAEQMLELLDERSPSIRQFGESALAYFRSGSSEIQRYRSAKGHFEMCFPHWEVFFEHILVNHMFFSQFPFQDRPESMHDEYIAICALYTLIRFLALGCMGEKNDAETLIDVMAAAFRLVDHTEFDRYGAHMMKRLGCTNTEQLQCLIGI